MDLKHVVLGAATYLRALKSFRGKCAGGTGGSDSARYCYSVWLRHLVMARQKGLCQNVPTLVAELGPGDSIGVGLAALISGTEMYCGLDLIEFANVHRNLAIFDQLVRLFRDREDIPAEDEFPDLKPRLQSNGFPHHILPEEHLTNALAADRLRRIREAVAAPNGDGPIKYAAPWSNADIIQCESVDMIFSQAVLEHVEDLQGTYKAMFLWLKPRGYVSHQIDFRSHNLTGEWNGHWAQSDIAWKFIRGNRVQYSLNREPHSAHIYSLQKAGFQIVSDEKYHTPSRIRHAQLARRFRGMPDEDLITSGAFIQAIKA
jgi:hypothetical protein